MVRGCRQELPFTSYCASTQSVLPTAPVPTATPTGAQHSSRLLSMRAADVLLELPAKTEEQAFLPAGAVVAALDIGHHQ